MCTFLLIQYTEAYFLEGRQEQSNTHTKKDCGTVIRNPDPDCTTILK